MAERGVTRFADSELPGVCGNCGQPSDRHTWGTKRCPPAPADGPAGEREPVRFALSFLCGFLASRRDPALSPAEWGQCCAEAVRQAMIEYQVLAALPSRADAPAPEREPSVARAIQAGVDFFARYWGRSQTDLAEMRDFFEAVAAAARRASGPGAPEGET